VGKPGCQKTTVLAVSKTGECATRKTIKSNRPKLRGEIKQAGLPEFI
jgi:hypothetical protein